MADEIDPPEIVIRTATLEGVPLTIDGSREQPVIFRLNGPLLAYVRVKLGGLPSSDLFGTDNFALEGAGASTQMTARAHTTRPTYDLSIGVGSKETLTGQIHVGPRD
jgi:hypothetical protein